MYRAMNIIAMVVVLAMGAWSQEVPEPPQQPTPAPTPAPAPRPRPRPMRSMHARTMMDEDAQHGRAYLGVDVSSVNSQRASELKLKDAHGVEVLMVDGDSPAGKAGLREHDVIQSFDGKPVGDSSDLQRLLSDSAPGKTAAVGIVRNGQPTSVNVTLASRQTMSMSDMRIEIPAMHITIPTMPEIPVMVMTQSWRRSGVQVESLSSQLREYFGAKSGEGILVRSVEKGSRAEQAGLKAGDVIVRVGNQRIGATDDFMRAMRDARGGNVQVGIIRDRREQSLSLNLPANGPGDGSEMRDLEINIPAGEIRAGMQDWAEQFRVEMKRNAEEWKREWRQQQKEWEKQQKEWEKDQKDLDKQ